MRTDFYRIPFRMLSDNSNFSTGCHLKCDRIHTEKHYSSNLSVYEPMHFHIVMLLIGTDHVNWRTTEMQTTNFIMHNHSQLVQPSDGWFKIHSKLLKGGEMYHVPFEVILVINLNAILFSRWTFHLRLIELSFWMFKNALKCPLSLVERK